MLFLLVAGLVIWSFCALIVSRLNDPVGRGRVERFARRQALDVTADNGNLVIRYLATTRRWRAGGLLLAAIGVVVGSVVLGRFSVNLFALFGGWFVGAVLAEWRVSSASSGSRRAARLAPRRRRDYLDVPARALPIAAVVVCSALAVAILIGGADRGRAVWLPLAGWLVATLVGLTLLVVAQRHVLGRPQPVVTRDVLAADEAIRIRSMRVIAGAGVATAGIPAAALVNTLATAYPRLDPSEVHGLSSLALLVAIILGAALAYAPVRHVPAHPARTP
ncbi:MAG: hypothetical protein ACRDLV_00905 [Solirubrobacteraceae bacterium]